MAVGLRTTTISSLTGLWTLAKASLTGLKAACRRCAVVFGSRFIVTMDFEPQARRYNAASLRAQRSASRMRGRSGCSTTACRDMTRATSSLICGKLMRRLMKASTATSLAAFKTAGNVPPISPARRASSRAGKRSGSGSSKVSCAEFGQVGLHAVAGHAVGIGQRVLNRQAHVRRGHLRQHRAVHKFNHGMHHALRMNHHLDTRPISMSKSQRASIISRPLLKRRGRINGDFPAHDPGRMLERALDGDGGEFLLRRVARKGPPEAVSQRRRTELEGLPSRHWKMAECSLSTARTRTPCSRASRMTISPAMTRISLEATAMSLPARMAASAGLQSGRADNGDQYNVRPGQRGQFEQAFVAGKNMAERRRACSAIPRPWRDR